MTDHRINGWTVLLHPCFAEPFEQLVQEVERLRARDPETYRDKRPSKLLAAIERRAFVDIPADPSDPAFRQGGTLGPENRHWFRAKFLGQYRLFFRYDDRARIIVLAWVNDETTKRAYGSRTDAYEVFRRMLASGHPPDSWDDLLREARED